MPILLRQWLAEVETYNLYAILMGVTNAYTNVCGSSKSERSDFRLFSIRKNTNSNISITCTTRKINNWHITGVQFENQIFRTDIPFPNRNLRVLCPHEGGSIYISSGAVWSDFLEFSYAYLATVFAFSSAKRLDFYALCRRTSIDSGHCT